MLALRRLTTTTTTRCYRVPLAAAAATTAPSARFLSEQPLRKAQKVRKKKKKRGSSGEGGRDKQLELVLRALDAPKTRPPPADEEEMARRYQVGRNYNIGCFERHNENQHDLACKLAMKQHAIKMLPKDSKIREEALNVDYGLTKLGPNDPLVPPLEQPIPREFPPVVKTRKSRN